VSIPPLEPEATTPSLRFGPCCLCVFREPVGSGADRPRFAHRWSRMRGPALCGRHRILLHIPLHPVAMLRT
jgi:hypothetical protein